MARRSDIRANLATALAAARLDATAPTVHEVLRNFDDPQCSNNWWIGFGFGTDRSVEMASPSWMYVTTELEVWTYLYAGGNGAWSADLQDEIDEAMDKITVAIMGDSTRGGYAVSTTPGSPAWQSNQAITQEGRVVRAAVGRFDVLWERSANTST